MPVLFTLYLFQNTVQRETVFFCDVSGIALAVGFGTENLEAPAAFLNSGYQVVDLYTTLGQTGGIDFIHGGGKIVQVGGEDSASAYHGETLQHFGSNIGAFIRTGGGERFVQQNQAVFGNGFKNGAEP